MPGLSEFDLSPILEEFPVLLDINVDRNFRDIKMSKYCINDY